MSCVLDVFDPWSFYKVFWRRFQTRSNHPNPPASSPREGRTHSLRYCGSVTCKAWYRLHSGTHHFAPNFAFKFMDPLPSCWCEARAYPRFGSTALLISYFFILIFSETKAISKMVILVPNLFYRSCVAGLCCYLR